MSHRRPTLDSALRLLFLAVCALALGACTAAAGPPPEPTATARPLPTPGGVVPTPPILGSTAGDAPPTPQLGGMATPTLRPELWTPSPEGLAAADAAAPPDQTVADAQAGLVATAQAAIAPTGTDQADAVAQATGGQPAPTGPTLDPPQRTAINGVAYEVIVVLPEDVLARAREIHAAGLAQGRNPRAFSKVGDSTIQNPHFLARFDDGPYNLGDYAYLQPVVDRFRGSFGREGAAVRLGLHSWSAVDPAWADKSICGPGETPVACEIRLHNPSILLIRLGTNDVGVGELFEQSVRQIVDTAIAAGVIPVIGTKADRHEGSNENNDTLRRIAADYRIPLWDFDQVANTLPGRGLDVDYIHMNTFFAHDYTDPTAFTRGHAMHNLTALMMLDALWRLVLGE